MMNYRIPSTLQLDHAKGPEDIVEEQHGSDVICNQLHRVSELRTYNSANTKSSEPPRGRSARPTVARAAQSIPELVDESKQSERGGKKRCTVLASRRKVFRAQPT